MTAPILTKLCQNCNEPFGLRRNPGRTPEHPSNFDRRKFCSAACGIAGREGRKAEPVRFCGHCGKQFFRRQNPGGGTEGFGTFSRRRYCGLSCGALAAKGRPPGSTISDPSTGHYRARKLVPPGPCRRCGIANARDVHHINGDHFDNDPANLERLCHSCHIAGHKAAPPRECHHCPRRVYGFELCRAHYERLKRYGDPLLSKRRNGTYALEAFP